MKTLLFILVAVFTTLFLIVVFIIFEYLGQNSPIPNNPKVAIPTLIPNQKETNVSPPPFSYNPEKSNKLIDLSKNRRALSDDGQNSKNTIVQNLNSKPGEVFTNSNVQIAYLPSMDAFIAEIRSANISQAKKDAVDFLTSQGFTKEDVCRLPLSFYLSAEVKESISEARTVFNPLPEGC